MPMRHGKDMDVADTPTRAPSLTLAAPALPLPALSGTHSEDFAGHKQPQHNGADCEHKLQGTTTFSSC